MFVTRKRHEREKQELLSASRRLSETLLNSSPQGLFILDAKDRILPPVSASLAVQFRRDSFANLSFEKLLGPLITAKTLSAVRAEIARLLDPQRPANDAAGGCLQDVEVRLPNPDGSFDAAHYSFDFISITFEPEPRCWLVRVSDITARVQQQRELDDLKSQHHLRGEILRSVLQSGGARFGAFLQKTNTAMKSINGVLKKPAREAQAFRDKLEATLDEVDRIRRDAAALKLSGLEAAARQFEDALQELRSREALSGSDFLPLAVKLDQLYGQFAQLRSAVNQAGPSREAEPAEPEARMTDNGTQIIEAPKFLLETPWRSPGADGGEGAAPRRMAAAGSLDHTLASLTDLAAQENGKEVSLACSGLELVPVCYQGTIKNVAIQLIRNAVLHGIEPAAERAAAHKPAHGSLTLEFKVLREGGYELLFQDDGRGLDPDVVRSTAVARGVITEEAAGRLRDRQVIKLIFKSGYSTLAAPGDASHGAGMSLVRRYVHESGGKIAIASLLGHETRFKVTLPPQTLTVDTQVA